MKNAQKLLAVFLVLPALVNGAGRDPFHWSEEYSVKQEQEKSAHYAGIVGDGRCWAQWWVNTSGLWQKSSQERCVSGVPLSLLFLSFTAASTLQWCPAVETDAGYPFSCPP